jgi:hypothetical protein
MSARGFAFEGLIGVTLGYLKETLEKEGWVMVIHTEQGIRDFFKEQSLNGVDHMIQIQDPTGEQWLFMIQEKWKLITNQREVSQFLDCCARILARMPDYTGGIQRMWVSRTVPTLNGEKSLEEGQVLVVQSCTSQTVLAYMTAILVAEVVGRRTACDGILGKLEEWLPVAEEPAPPTDAAPVTTFVPVSNFGEKRVHTITKKTMVKVKKAVEHVITRVETVPSSTDFVTPIVAPRVKDGVAPVLAFMLS